jgi:hypothetical protein
MSALVIAGDTSGSVTLQAPAVAGSTVFTLPSTSGAFGAILLATITPTAATTIQSLNLFTSTYDNYLIIYDNIQTSSATGTCTLDMRFAVAGAVVSTASYGSSNGPGNASTTYTTTYINLQFGVGTLDPAYQACSGQFMVMNANSTTTGAFKFVSGTAVMPATTSAAYGGGNGVFSSSSAITGFSMFLRNGVNFAAQGSVRVYGYVNS